MICNAKVMKTEIQNNINSNIQKIFDEEIIPFLPKLYVNEVLELCPSATKEQIRVIKHRKSGDINIINALKKVAEQNKNLLTS